MYSISLCHIALPPSQSVIEKGRVELCDVSAHTTPDPRRHTHTPSLYPPHISTHIGSLCRSGLFIESLRLRGGAPECGGGGGGAWADSSHNHSQLESDVPSWTLGLRE